MGQLRSINHPGQEIIEIDASGATEQVGGCTSLVVGFFPQGESSVPVNPTSLKSVKSYFGTPETEAERYAYYACKTVFDNGGKLIAARIPYDNNSQYLTPACKFNIEEWSTTHVTEYDSTTVAKYIHTSENVYSTAEYTEKSEFYSGANPVISTLTIDSTKTFDGINTTISTSDVKIITSDTKSGSKSTYYTVSFNGPLYTSTNASVHSGEEIITEEIKAYVKSFSATDSSISSFTTISVTISSDSISETNFDLSNSESTSSVSIGSFGKAEAVISEGYLTGEVKIYQKSEDGVYYEEPVATISNLIYQQGHSVVDGQSVVVFEDGMKLNQSLFSAEHSEYITITEHSVPQWKYPTVSVTSDDGYYNETLTSSSEKLSNFLFDKTVSQPTTAYVEKLTASSTPITSIAIKSYYKSGEGIVYPSMDSDDFLELRIWNSSSITALSSLTEDAADDFDIIECTYSGIAHEETTVVSDNKFNAVPTTADVSTDYTSTDGTITDKLLAIPGQDELDTSKLPDTITVENPVGNGYIKVLSKLNDGTVICSSESDLDSSDFYQFVSPYTSVKDVALAKSSNYNWIHYTTNTALSGEGDYKNGILVSSTLGCPLSSVPDGLSKIENTVTIVPDEDNLGYIPLSDYLDYRDEAKKVDENTIVIANITEQKFEKDTFNNTNDEISNGEEVLGIVPVLMSGFQALPKQSRIEIPTSITNSKIFNALESIVRGSSIEDDPAPTADHVDVKSVTLNSDGFVKTLGNTNDYDPYESTYSNTVLSKVPSIDLNSNYKPNGAKTNYVTLVVCKLTISSVNDNKVALTVLESFSGSLESSAKDDSGNSVFIDNVVNNDETGSAYVKLFSNYQSSLSGSETRTAAIKKVIKPASQDTKITLVTPKSCGSSKWWASDKKAFTLGFVEEQTNKYISYATMVATLENVYDMLSNVDEQDIDLVVDAGLTSIANRIKKYIDANPDATKCEYDLTFDKINSVTDVAGWKSMAAKLITFCQTTRKDCMALIDAPRSLCVKNNAKLIDSKKTTTSKYTVDFDILPKFNFLGGLNSSYGAGFCDWILAVDDFTAKNIWMPPSIAAEGNIIYTDYNSNCWMAPAGEKRGNIPWAVDIAFNPSAAQQDSIYSKGWNYAISASGNIMTWGQKTFLTSTSSFNRINVRRLFLRLERLVRKNSKWVIFELNNQKTRNIYLDRIDPIFSNVKAMGGLYDYQLICDERNNSGTVIDAQEFRFTALLKPSKTAEFVILTFENLNTDAQWSEAYGDL